MRAGNLFTAYRNQTPLVVTAGQQARSILPLEPFLFAQNAPEFPKPYVKWSNEPARAEDVPAAIARAYYTAMQPPRGPCFVSIPIDDWDRACEPVEARQVSRTLRGDAGMLAAVADALAKAEKPAFVVGAALARDDAWDEVIALAERHEAPVWASPMSARNSFPEDHRLFAGFLVAAREPIVESLKGHDLILVLGAPAFTYHVEGFGPFVPEGATLFQLIDDPAMAAWAPVGSAVVTSLKAGIADLLEGPQPRKRATLSVTPPRAPSFAERRSPTAISCSRSRRYGPRTASSSRKRRAAAGRCTIICRSSSATPSTPARAAGSAMACPRRSASRWRVRRKK